MSVAWKVIISSLKLVMHSTPLKCKYIFPCKSGYRIIQSRKTKMNSENLYNLLQKEGKGRQKQKVKTACINSTQH